MISQHSAFVREGLVHFADTLRAINLDERALSGALDLLIATRLPVVCSGVGKSGFIAAKLVATLNSLGVKALYLNPTDALHGDLGVVADESVVILISNSGSTVELRNLAPALTLRNCKIISIVSNRHSPLAKAATCVLDYGKITEVDEHALAPTTSTVVQLALADILAATVSRARGLKPNDFYRNHPAGALGKRLMRVDALMRTGEGLPTVRNDSPLTEVLSVIGAKHIGCTCVVDENECLLGLITDGDIRRGLERRIDVYAGVAADIMQREPRTARLGEFIEHLMQENDYLGRHFTIPVVNDSDRLQGIIVSIDLI